MGNERALALVPQQAPTALTVAEVKALAEAAADSGLYPNIRTPQAAFTLMMLCQSEGLHPVQALRRYHIIEGKPSLNADAMLGDFIRYGGKVEWVACTETECRAVFTPPGSAGVPVAWTMDDAKRAELAGKGNWKKFPRQMLRARVISEGVRMTMPSIVTGTYTPEEVQDFAPATFSPVASERVSTTGATRDGRFDVEADEVVHDESLELVPVFDPSTGEQVGRQPKLTQAQQNEIERLQWVLRNNLTDGVFQKRLIKTFSKDRVPALSTGEAAKLIETLLKAEAKSLAKLETAGLGAQPTVPGQIVNSNEGASNE